MTYLQSKILFSMVLLVASTLSVAGSAGAPTADRAAQPASDKKGSLYPAGAQSGSQRRNPVSIPAKQASADDDC